MVIRKNEAQGIANEALKAIATNPDFYNLKDLIGRELDVTDEALDEAVEVLFRSPDIVILDAGKFMEWENGSKATKRALDNFGKYKTLWDIPFTYLPAHVFAVGFEIASLRLPSDGAGVRIMDHAAKNINVSWINAKAVY